MAPKLQGLSRGEAESAGGPTPRLARAPHFFFLSFFANETISRSVVYRGTVRSPYPKRKRPCGVDGATLAGGPCPYNLRGERCDDSDSGFIHFFAHGSTLHCATHHTARTHRSVEGRRLLADLRLLRERERKERERRTRAGNSTERERSATLTVTVESE